MITLCLDPGTAHTGLAISQEGILVTPVGTVYERDLDRLIGKLIPLLARYSPDKIVIGVPEYGPMIALARDLSQKLHDVYAGEILFFPEAHSSDAARQTMKDQQKTLAKRKREEHQTAAALILQDYLDSL